MHQGPDQRRGDLCAVNPVCAQNVLKSLDSAIWLAARTGVEPRRLLADSVLTFTIFCCNTIVNRSRRESNPHLRFRKPLFYPLNYGNRNTRRKNTWIGLC